MKVIKASVDLKTWCLQKDCPYCASVIEIEATDLRYHWSNNSCYYYICILCNKKSYLKDDEVPEIVKADILNNRRDPTSYYD